MRGTVVLLLALAVLFLTAQGTGHAQSTTTYNASGAYAESSFTTNNSFVNLFVARGCTVTPCTNIGTFIVWFSFNNNSDGTMSVTEGDGIIPDTAFQSATLDHMSLNVDTSQVPGFSTVTCTMNAGVFNCNNGPFGVMQADWHSTQQASNDDIEDVTTVSGPFTVKTHDDSKSTSGMVSGTFLGSAFSDSSRTTLGTNRSHTHSITKPQ